MRRGARLRAALAAALALGLAACASERAPAPSDEGAHGGARAEDPTVALRGVLLPAFAAAEPAVREVRVLELLARPSADDAGFAVLARGHVRTAEGDGDPIPMAADRLGVFEVSLELDSVRRTIAVFAPVDTLPELRLAASRDSLFVSAGPAGADGARTIHAWPWPSGGAR